MAPAAEGAIPRLHDAAVRGLDSTVANLIVQRSKRAAHVRPAAGFAKSKSACHQIFVLVSSRFATRRSESRSNRLEPVAGCRRTCHAVPILDLRVVDGRGRSTFHHVGSGTSLTFRAVDVLPIYRGSGRGLLEQRRARVPIFSSRIRPSLSHSAVSPQAALGAGRSRRRRAWRRRHGRA